MPRRGRRYSLLLYTRLMDRWWPAVGLLGVGLFALAWAVHQFYPEPLFDWQWMTLGGVGGFVLLFALFLLLLRKAAYVQLYNDHLRLVTPFLRLNISYKRVIRTSSATMEGLFPPASVSRWQREIIEPLAHRTAVVVDLNGYPASQGVLRFYLSPFFFKDKTPHFVLLVEDWMRFSAELESLRTGGGQAPRPRPNQSILSRLPHK